MRKYIDICLDILMVTIYGVAMGVLISLILDMIVS